MFIPNTSIAALRGALAAAAVLAASLPAHAVLDTPSSIESDGTVHAMPYGSSGSIFQFQPFLFVQGLGNIKDPTSIVTLNPALTFTASNTGIGTNLATFTFTITNTSATDSFNDLRFAVFANPDGDQTSYLDVVTEKWDAVVPTGNPVSREAAAFDFDPIASIIGRMVVNNGLTNGAPAAACTASAGCDATVGLQWGASVLNPGDSFIVRVGLSDNGTALSQRFLTITSVANPGDTALTLSGLSEVVSVPEPQTWALLASGLGLGGLLARRRPS